MRTSLGLVLLIGLASLVLALAAHTLAADPPGPEPGGDARPEPAVRPPRLGPSAPGGDVTVEEHAEPACAPGRCEMTVQVVTADGRPVAGAHVGIVDADFYSDEHEGETGDDGVLRFVGLDPGAHHVGVRALGCALAARIVGTAPDGDTRVEMTVTPGPPLRGCVRNIETDAPIPDVRVHIHRARMVGHLSGIAVPWRIGRLLGSARTDADGAFVVPHVPGDAAVAIVEAEGWATATKLFTRHGPESQSFQARVSKAVPRISLARLDVRLGRGASLGGRVLDTGGAPVGGATVEIVARDLGFKWWLPCDGKDGALAWNRSLFGGPSERVWGPLFLRDLWRRVTTRADAQGVFHVEGLATGEPCLVRAWTAEACSPEVEVRPLGEAESPGSARAPALTLALTRPPLRTYPDHSWRREAKSDGSVRSGRVLDDAGRPVAGARITRPQAVASDGEGHFRLAWAHAYQTVNVTAVGHEQGEVQLGEDASESLVVILPRLAIVRLALVLSPGAPPPSRIHVLVPRAGEELTFGNALQARHVIPWPDGASTRAVFPVEVPAGVTEIAVEAEGFLPWSSDLALETGRSVAVPVQLDAGLALEGVLRDDEGRRLANVPFTLWAPQIRRRGRGRTRDDGTFRVTGLPRAIPRAGFFRVPGYATDPPLPVETWGTPVDLQLTRLTRLVVRVVDQDGYPVARAEVGIQHEQGQILAERRTTRAGRVVLDVEPGRRRIGVWDRKRGVHEWSDEKLDLRPGTTTHRVLSVVR